MESVVLSLGGSILISQKNPEAFLGDLCALLEKVSSEVNLYVVVGGGWIARYYITQGRAKGLSEHELDLLGIGATRMNSRLLTAVLGSKLSNQHIPESVEAMVQLSGGGSDRDSDGSSGVRSNKIPIKVMGGTEPGHTTDAVSAMLLESVGGTRLINATSVNGVYNRDPNIHSDAVHLPELTHERMVQIAQGGGSGAGPHIVFDPTGAKILQRLQIPLYVVKGWDLTALENALLGKDFDGSIVID